jgi:sensor histidine kinase YesM
VDLSTLNALEVTVVGFTGTFVIFLLGVVISYVKATSKDFREFSSKFSSHEQQLKDNDKRWSEQRETNADLYDKFNDLNRR